MRGIEAQVWRNVPPFPAVTLYRAKCSCGRTGSWFYYRENSENEKCACGARVKVVA